jgi:uncharacterized membrane protein
MTPLVIFAIAMATFILLHSAIAGSPVRSVLVRAIGEPAYRGVFSLASVAAFAWVVIAYGAARGDPTNAVLWTTPDAARPVAIGLISVGLVIGFAGLLTPSPTAVGFEGMLAKNEPAKGMTRITRHPFLVGASLWGAGHLIVNGDRAAIVLFFGVFYVALSGMRSIDRKRRLRDPEGWAKFAAATSIIPFAAIVQGRNRFVFRETAMQGVLALVIVCALVWFHASLFGAPAIAGLG